MSLQENISHAFREYPKMKDRIDELEAEVARLRNDLLAYGHHLECCQMLVLAKTDGWRYAKLHGCSCGFDKAKEK